VGFEHLANSRPEDENGDQKKRKREKILGEKELIPVK